MNTLKGLSLTALLIAGSMSFVPATQATTEAPTQALSQAPVEAPLTALTYDSPTVTTSPAPATEAPTTEAPTAPILEAPAEATVEAPATAPTPALVEAPTEQPTAALEAPAEAPATDPYSGNPFVDCAAEGKLTAEDSTCVLPDFYSTPTVPEEAFALSGYTDRETFSAQYVGFFPVTERGANVRTVQSVISPSYEYVFWVTTAPTLIEVSIPEPSELCLDVLVPAGTPGNYCSTY